MEASPGADRPLNYVKSRQRVADHGEVFTPPEHRGQTSGSGLEISGVVNLGWLDGAAVADRVSGGDLPRHRPGSRAVANLRGRREAAGVSRPGGGSGRALPLAVGSGRSRPLFAGGSARGRLLALGLGEGLDPTAD